MPNKKGNTGGKSERGFAAMSEEKQREIASKGGKASHGGGRSSGGNASGGNNRGGNSGGGNRGGNKD